MQCFEKKIQRWQHASNRPNSGPWGTEKHAGVPSTRAGARSEPRGTGTGRE